jgi:hypothetical protein
LGSDDNDGRWQQQQRQRARRQAIATMRFEMRFGGSTGEPGRSIAFITEEA